MILILTRPSDDHSEAVIDCLKKKGVRHLRFQTSDFPQKIGTTLRYNDGDDKHSLSININGDHSDLGAIHTVWFRRPELPLPSQDLSAGDQNFVRRESEHVLEALWHLLGDRFWVNPYASDRAADHKPYQLQVAQAAGLEVPRTLITNEPDGILEFFDRCGGEIIYKTFSGYARGENGRTKGIYTTRVTREDLISKLEAVRMAPCLFQEYVSKKVELRVTIIGRKMFTTEIHSQSDDLSKDDWRKCAWAVERLPLHTTVLPERVQEGIRCLMSQLGLVFGCVDLIRTPDDRFVFLEINPNGQWYWVEQLTGMPLVDNFTEMLIQGTLDYTASQPAT